MPYIPEQDREPLDTLLDALASRCDNEGSLNYAITRLIRQYVEKHGESYGTHNAVMGVLHCAGLEHYRTRVARYENAKRSKHGDVRTTTDTTDGGW